MLQITKEKVLEAANKCSESKRTLEILFPEVFNKDNSVRIDRLKNFLCVRQYGNLAHKSFYLDREYDWRIVEDDDRQLVLQPTKK